jgi:uncharacterized protein DUF6920
VEAVHLGSGGSQPAAGLRLERSCGDDAWPSRAGARRLRGGGGVLHASLLGLFTVADMSGRGDVAEGELMRFLAEAAWYPTALLPSQGVRWEASGYRSAYATLDEGDHTIRMLFTFDERGLIDTVRASARGRAVGGEVVPAPWHCRFWNYQERGGMPVPIDGEVAWLLPEGEKPYWRGHITEITYRFAR